jgi:DNA polymerase-3 subunit alpha
MMAALESAMEMGQKIQKEKESAQVSLFGADEIIKGNGNGKCTLPDIPEWGEKELLAFEKEAIGFYITGHPLARHEADARRLGTADTSTLAEKPDKSEVRICGIVASLSEKITKKGDRMAFAVLEDRLGSVEIMVFPDVFARASEYLKSDEPLLVTGIVDIGEESRKIKTTEIIPLRMANEQQTQRVNFTLMARSLQVPQLESLKEIICRYRGACKAFLHIVTPERIRTTIILPDTYSVQASEDLSLEVERLLGYNATTFE